MAEARHTTVDEILAGTYEEYINASLALNLINKEREQKAKQAQQKAKQR